MMDTKDIKDTRVTKDINSYTEVLQTDVAPRESYLGSETEPEPESNSYLGSEPESNSLQESVPEYGYQVFARESLNDKKKTGLLAKPGSGKTRIILESLRDQKCLEGPNLILCSGPAIATWKKEIPKWLGSSVKVVVISGEFKPHLRSVIWNAARVRDSGPCFYITNYACFRRDFKDIYGPPNRKALHWKSAVADEYHKAFRRRKSQTFNYWKQITQFLDTAIAASGTSVGRDPSSLFTLFQFINRRVFSSYWAYVNTWCIVIDGYSGKQILGAKPTAIPQLKKVIDQYIVNIPPEVIADQLPQGIRQALDVEMTKEQRKIYGKIKNDMMFQVGDKFILTPHAMAQHIKLRKLLCCPRIIDPSLGLGGGYEKILDELDDAPHAIIFVPFRDAVTVLSRQLKQDLPKSHIYPMMGQMGAEAQKEATDGFRANKGIIVCTIDYAESWDAETCRSSYFLGYTPSVPQLQQAEGRTERAISKHETVIWRYLKYSNTLDEDALMDIDRTFMNIKRVMTRPEEYINAIKNYGE